MNVKTLSRKNKDFYRLLGPIFGSRKVAKEIGINVYDDSDKEWFVAMDGEVLIGLASLRGSIISDCYVRPNYRRAGIFKMLLAQVLLVPIPVFRANCTSLSLGAFLAQGFHIISKTKNFTKVEKNA